MLLFLGSDVGVATGEAIHCASTADRTLTGHNNWRVTTKFLSCATLAQTSTKIKSVTDTSQLLPILAAYLALFLSIGFHEFSHVLSAYLQGDMTGKLLGRLTLNPLKHLDPFGTLMILVARIGWGKPAPFNPYNLRYRRWGPTLVALAGPASNIVLVMISGYALLLIGPHLPSTNLLIIFLQAAVVVNATLAIFNLLPVAPLDGSHVVAAIAGPQHPLTIFLQRYGPFLLLALVAASFFGGGILNSYIFGGSSLLLRALGLGRLF